MATKLENFSCICGCQTVCQSLVEVDGLEINQLYCPDCGIIMRSPSTDAGGKWLRKHWEAIIMRGNACQKRMCKDCQWYKNKWQCTNESSAYYKNECSSLFGCNCFKPKEDAE